LWFGGPVRGDFTFDGAYILGLGDFVFIVKNWLFDEK